MDWVMFHHHLNCTLKMVQKQRGRWREKEGRGREREAERVRGRKEGQRERQREHFKLTNWRKFGALFVVKPFSYIRPLHVHLTFHVLILPICWCYLISLHVKINANWRIKRPRNKGTLVPDWTFSIIPWTHSSPVYLDVNRALFGKHLKWNKTIWQKNMQRNMASPS